MTTVASPTPFLADSTDLLQRTPAVLTALLRGLPDSWTGTTDVEGGWRPRDAVGHLISAELDDWLPRIRQILETGAERPFDPFDRFAHVERDAEASLDWLLETFADLRARNLAELGRLVGDEDLDRRGLHPSLGEVTLRHLLATWTVHDLDHVSQVFAAIAAAGDADVGPWKAYLGILLRRDDPSAVPG